jgi:hypothetical protein
MCSLDFETVKEVKLRREKVALSPLYYTALQMGCCCCRTVNVHTWQYLANDRLPKRARSPVAVHTF